MAPTRTTRASVRNDPAHVHCSLTPDRKPRAKKRRKSFFNLTGQETHIAGVSRCQRIMKETMCELNEFKYDMETERSKFGYTDPNRKPVKNFVEDVESLLQDKISGGFNKLVLTALYPPEGAEPPTIPQLETAWSELLPTLTEVKEEYTRLCKMRDNNWATPEPIKPKAKTPRKATKRRGRKKVDNKEN